ncbi:sugar ABC transporter ATP-binding protein [Paenibacillus frigoriresistens]|uniref:sugar ABC transporter ATP-binding protein n=1 Tax=Paenibacillus alginolyticus TaxID=59839 RepID=UPI001564B11A|nr:sugar ABC transporter ATP-binding protein [Paenibacillus frigoriresistens]NRF94403.1 sugar ABC transporter ATP-binding protein [Paenibacillus frigoriresistens]
MDTTNHEKRPYRTSNAATPPGTSFQTAVLTIPSGNQPDEGLIVLNGKTVFFRSIAEAQRHGIAILHQEPALVPYMSVAENIFLGVEPRFAGFIPRFGYMKQESKRILKALGLSIHPNTPVRELSFGQQFIVAAAKALSFKSKILIMDEPTSCLSEVESEGLFDVIRTLKQEGVSIVYITHRLKEVMKICDRATFLRDGRHVATMDVAGMTEEDAIRIMLGKELHHFNPPILDEVGETLFKVEGLMKKPFFYDIGFSLREGEILGVFGMMGSGKSKLAKTLFGQDKPDGGKVFWRNRDVDFRIALVNDSVEEALFMNMGVNRNLTISGLDHIMQSHILNENKENDAALDAVMEMDIKIQHLNQEVKYLSRGNQQKVMLGKWLVPESDLYLLDEPTRGIDLRSKMEIYAKIHELAVSGKGVIVFSSDIPILMGLCTRILVMYQGHIVADLHHSEADEKKILQYATEGMSI